MATNTVLEEVADQGRSPVKGDTRVRCKTQEGVYSIICAIDASKSSRASTNKSLLSSQALNAPVRLSRPHHVGPGNVDNLVCNLFCINYGCDLYVFKANTTSKPGDLLKLIDSKSFEKIYPTTHDFRPLPAKSMAHSMLSNKQKKGIHNYEILIGMNNGQIYLADQYDVKKIFNVDHQAEKSKVTCLKWVPSNSNHFMAGYQSGFLYTYDVEKSPTFPIPSIMHQVSSSYNGKSRTPVSNSMVYQVFKESRGLCIYTIKSLLKSFSAHQHINPVYKWCFDGNLPVNDMAFSPCQKYLSVACQDGYLRIIDYENLELKTAVRSYFGGLRCVSWSMDSQYLAAGGDDDLITVFSMRDDSVLCRCVGHKSRINAVIFDSYVISSGNINASENNHSHLAEVQKHGEFLDKSSNSKGENVFNIRNSQFTSPGESSSELDKSGLTSNELVENSASEFYRLISVADDTFMCFWDLNIKELNNIHPISLRNKASVEESCAQNETQSVPLDGSSKCSDFSCNGIIHKHFFPLIFGKMVSKKGDNKAQVSDKMVISDLTISHENNFLDGHIKKKAFKVPPHKFASLSIFDQRKRDKETKRSSSAVPSQRFATVTGSEFGIKNKLLSHSNDLIAASMPPCDSISVALGSRFCPRLSEVPLIDPLVCKKVSHDRLVSLSLDADHIVMGSQDGCLYVWTRPIFAVKL